MPPGLARRSISRQARAPGFTPGDRGEITMRFLPAGERGLIVELGNQISLEINEPVLALAIGIEAAGIPGLTEVIPTYRSVGVEYDPLASSFEEMQRRIQEVAAHLDPRTLGTPKLVQIPTVYGGEYGPDLPFV